MKYFNKKICGFLLLFSTSAIYSNEIVKSKTTLNKHLGTIASSNLSSLLEQKLMTKICYILTKVCGNNLASSEYQELGKEAQAALGIPEKYQVPIKKFPSTMHAVQMEGLVAPNAIYVNEDRLKPLTYGMKRCTLFREAVRKKYNDVTCSFLGAMGALVGTTLIARTIYSKIFNRAWVYYPALLGTAFGTMVIAVNAYVKFTERRADKEGHYASQCYICVKESAERRRYIFEVEKNPLKDKGYLSATDLENIANDLEIEKKICRHHVAQIVI